jgi:hypothetical protein
VRRLFSLCALLAFGFAVAAQLVTVGEVATNPARYNARELTLQGTIAKFKAKVSRVGKPYFTFDLVDGKAKLAVYGRGALDPTPMNGNRVEVNGIFAVKRESAGVIFENELDVTTNGLDRHGIKILK